MTEEFSEENDTEYWYGDDVATFGDRLAAARLNSGMSQEQFSKRLGVKLSTVRAWEDDLNEPRANKLQMMSGLLSVSVTWLLMGEGDGISAPAGQDAQAAPELGSLLVEVRDIRAQMKSTLDQLARVEKRLRLKVNEAAGHE